MPFYIQRPRGFRLPIDNMMQHIGRCRNGRSRRGNLVREILEEEFVRWVWLFRKTLRWDACKAD